MNNKEPKFVSLVQNFIDRKLLLHNMRNIDRYSKVILYFFSNYMYKNYKTEAINYITIDFFHMFRNNFRCVC
jgi:hypothetical protein